MATLDPALDPGAMGRDPNTGDVAQPLTRAATHAMQMADYTDEWAKNLTAPPPVRTWRSPSQMQGDNGEYLAAWYDTPAQVTAAPAPADAPAPAPAPVAAPAAAPAPAPAPATSTLDKPGFNPANYASGVTPDMPGGAN